MLNSSQLPAPELDAPDPRAKAIRNLTARIRRRWSPEERRLRFIRALLFQRLLLQR